MVNWPSTYTWVMIKIHGKVRQLFVNTSNGSHGQSRTTGDNQLETRFKEDDIYILIKFRNLHIITVSVTRKYSRMKSM